jgi:hypothetical protein
MVTKDTGSCSNFWSYIFKLPFPLFERQVHETPLSGCSFETVTL